MEVVGGISDCRTIPISMLAGKLQDQIQPCTKREYFHIDNQALQLKLSNMRFYFLPLINLTDEILTERNFDA
jgi:hypothetical protein